MNIFRKNIERAATHTPNPFFQIKVKQLQNYAIFKSSGDCMPTFL